MTQTAAPADVVAEQAAWQQAWYSLSKKAQEAAPRVAVVEVTPAGDVCRWTFHNVGGTGLAVAERRAAHMTARTGRTYAVRVPQEARCSA